VALAIQVGTGIAMNDVGMFQTINKGLQVYLERKGYWNVKEIVGLAHQG
jgi:dihydroorotate dehydrogenase